MDLDFNTEEQHLPETFLKKDVNVNGRRHFVFATWAGPKRGISMVPSSSSVIPSRSCWSSTRS